MCEDLLPGSAQKISTKTGYFSAFLNNYDYWGYDLSGLGDVDGDTIPDVMVTAYADDEVASDAGAVYVVFLTAEGTVGSFHKITVSDLTASEHFGISCAGLSGLNDDGFVNAAVGARYNDDGGYNIGAVYVLGLDSSGSVQSLQRISAEAGNFTGVLAANDYFGSSVADGGDLNGDSVTDLLVGAPTEDDGSSDRGALFLLFLNPVGSVVSHTKISNTRSWFTAVLDNSDYFGSSAAGLSDMNGDGTRDIAVGATHDDDGGTDRGAVYVIFLHSYRSYVLSHQKISDLSGGLTAEFANSDYFGASVSSLGDINGDGVTDILVGAHSADDGGGSSGAAFVLYLDTEGFCLSHQRLSRTAGPYSLEEVSNGDYFGKSAGLLGDVNGDLIMDFAVGAYGDYESGAASTGSIHVIFGTGGT